MRNANISLEYLKAMEEARMTPRAWAKLALKAIPIRSRVWREQAELNVASVIQQAMGSGRRCRYCHRTYSGKVCDNMSQWVLHPDKIQKKMHLQDMGLSLGE